MSIFMCVPVVFLDYHLQGWEGGQRIKPLSAVMKSLLQYVVMKKELNLQVKL